MIKFEKVRTYGFEGAIRGMRNPLNSWDKSDSYTDETGNYILGKNDLELAQRLCKEGSPNRKFLRMIRVQMDITAPLYWWKEYDTYKVSTVANSCSTMHTIHKKEFDIYDFSYEHLNMKSMDTLFNVIRELNDNRKLYSETKDKQYWWQMIQLLPTSYNQKRTVDVDYETLRGMEYWRENHKLDEWRIFCKKLEELPYAKELIFQ